MTAVDTFVRATDEPAVAATSPARARPTWLDQWRSLFWPERVLMILAGLLVIGAGLFAALIAAAFSGLLIVGC